MSLSVPPLFSMTARKAGHLTLASDQGDTAHIFALESDIIRVLVLPRGRLDQPRRLKIFRFLLDFWESWRLLRVRFGVGI